MQSAPDGVAASSMTQESPSVPHSVPDGSASSSGGVANNAQAPPGQGSGGGPTSTPQQTNAIVPMANHAAGGAVARPPASQLGQNGAVSQRAVHAVQQVKGLVQQGLAQQQHHVVATKEQLHAHVQGLNQLLRQQAMGLKQTQAQIAELESSLAPGSSPQPEVSDAFARLRHTHAKIVELHGMLARQLASVQQTQAQEQDQRFDQTKRHVGGLFNMLHDQTLQLDRTQQQVEALTRFAQQAQVQVQVIASSHEATMKKTQAQVEELEVKLEEQKAVQAELQKQLTQQQKSTKRPPMKKRIKRIKKSPPPERTLTPETVFADVKFRALPAEMTPESAKLRVAALTTELAQLMLLDTMEGDAGFSSDESC